MAKSLSSFANFLVEAHIAFVISSLTMASPQLTTKTTSIATGFIRKLYRMLDVEDPVVVGWDATGVSFSIHDEQQLDELVLPRYFRGRVDVFRQHLAEHGFRSTRTRNGSQQMVEAFFHENFIRGEPNRLSKIIATPTNKRRRSRMGKKRARQEVNNTDVQQFSVTSTIQPTEVEDILNCDLDYLLQEPTLLSTASASDLPSTKPSLHDELVRILALHATNPVGSSTAMVRQNCEWHGNQGQTQIETPIFSHDMMASMVEWLDSSA